MALLSHSMITQEQLVDSNRIIQCYTVGVVKEDKSKDTRVALTPQGTAMLIDAGHQVFVESGVGLESKFTDLDYADYGAQIVERSIALQQDVVLMITPPILSDIDHMKKNAMLFSMMSYGDMCKDRLEHMRKKHITAVALEWVESDYDDCPIANSMYEIEGNAAIVLAANMGCYAKGKGAMLGSVAGVSPSEVVILGAGTAGQSAARCAIGMGATVKFFDSSLRALQQVRHNFGDHIFTSILHPNALAKSLQTAEVVIGALGEDDTFLPFVVAEDVIKTMKKDAVIIDLNIKKGGSFETSRASSLSKPTYRSGGVHYCCLPSLATMYPRTASIALSNIVAPLLLSIDRYENYGQYVCSELGFQSGIYMYHGVLVNHEMGRHFGLSAKELQLLLTVF